MPGIERSPLREFSPLLAVRGLSKSFGARQALAELSLSVGPGEIVGLVGSNGSGKTTSLRILAGLMKPDAGAGQVLDFDLSSRSAEIRRRVGYLSQRDLLYKALTVRENLWFRADAFALGDPAKVVSAAVERFQLQPFENQPAGRLSGGWARIAQLAVTLLHEPRVVMLDEPTAGLDVAARQAVWRHLTRLAGEGRALLLSTHDILDASRCSSVVLLSQGRVRAHGRPSDLVLATQATVLAIPGARAFALVEALQGIPGVITSYPSGASLRVLVSPGAQQDVVAFVQARDLPVYRADPTLEDAYLGLSRREFQATMP
jgi:ABC-2 type transport system ATP-binding protein